MCWRGRKNKILIMLCWFYYCFVKSEFWSFRGSSYVLNSMIYKFSMLLMFIIVVSWFQRFGVVTQEDFYDFVMVSIMVREIWSLEFQMVFVRISYALNFVMLMRSIFVVLWLLLNDIDVLEGSCKNIFINLCCVLIVFREIKMLVFNMVFVCMKFNDLQFIVVVFYTIVFNDFNVLEWSYNMF